jgi:hypothetical protein
VNRFTNAAAESAIRDRPTEGNPVPHRPTFSTLWAINGPLDPGELRSQLRDFVRAGLDGVVFHPRFYPGEPAYLSDEYLRIVSDLILEARDLGLAFWIYDEDGWPSGTVGGRMLEEHPELRQRWVELQPDTGQPAVRRFAHDDRAWAVVERLGEGVDYLSAGLAPHFIELCYARYAEGIAPEALAHVAGFFSDEPEFGLGHAQHELAPGGALPWTPDLADRYADRHGTALVDDLQSLFLTDEHSAAVRTRFWELVTDLFAERYLGVLDRWCRDRGLRFTAHMKGEEHPLFQLPTLGALGSVSRAIGTPGIDALGRHPINDFFPRQVASVARQFGDGRAMAEAFGGAGWGASPDDLARYLRWLGGHGITDFMLHISQYRLDTAAIEDWPPSHPRHVSWSELYADVLDDVRAALAAAPRPAADVLVVVPQRGIAERFEPWEFVATNVHDAHDFPDTPAGRVNADFLALVQRLHAAGVAYEFADERTLERAGRLDDGGLALGDARYRRVIVASGARLDPEVAARLAPLLTSEGDGCLAPQPPHEGPPPRETHSMTVSWRFEARPVNELVLTPERSPGDDGWVASATSRDYGGPVEVRFADEPAFSTWAGAPLTVQPGRDRGFVATAELAPGDVTELRFGPAGPVEQGVIPRVWIAGEFAVHASPAEHVGSGLDRALVALGEPFSLGAPDAASAVATPPDLTVAGYPFLFEPVEAVAQLELPAGAEAVKLVGGIADAARLQLGAGNAVWRWSPEGWEIPVEGQAGQAVELRVRLVPSSFNRYGPHHHYLGDPPVVSPAQMRGERNYADADDAPSRTHVAHWWVRRLALPSSVEITVPDAAHAEGASALVDNQVTRS